MVSAQIDTDTGELVIGIPPYLTSGSAELQAKTKGGQIVSKTINAEITAADLSLNTISTQRYLRTYYVTPSNTKISFGDW
jgi:hypothetical protein